ncbi:vma7 [Nucleospora cyclopteri]
MHHDYLITVIADEDTITGFKIGGIVDNGNNFLSVTSETETEEIINFFVKKTKEKHIGIIFISDFIAKKLNKEITEHKEILPSILVIPNSKSNLEIFLNN